MLCGFDSKVNAHFYSAVSLKYPDILAGADLPLLWFDILD